jgi:hypothetical protein
VSVVSVDARPVQGNLVPTEDLTPPQLVQMAVARGVDTEQLKELMQLQREWKADQARDAFTAAMTAFKAEPLRVVKNKQVGFKDTKYRHATLAQVVDAVVVGLSKHGLSHRWETKQDGNMITVTCIITHKLGHSERTPLSAGPDTSGSKNSIQAIGSTVTYLQRYTLMAATGLAASDTDDDGGGGDRPPTITEEQEANLLALMEEIGYVGERRAKLLKMWGLEKLGDMLASNYGAAMRQLESKRQ